VTEECVEEKRVSYLISLFLSNEISEGEEESLLKCFPATDKMSNQSNITIKKFQIPLDISSKEIEKIKKLKANKPVSNWPKFYLNERVFKLKNPTRKRLVFNYKPVLDKLEDENNVFSLLLKSYIYLRIGNVARSEFLIDKILRMDISAQFLQFSQVELNEQRRKDVLNRILWVIKYFEDRFDNEIKVEMLKMVIAVSWNMEKKNGSQKSLIRKEHYRSLEKLSLLQTML
jgi:hypothetical protein